LIQFKELNIILNNSKKKFLIKIILKNFPLNSKKKFKKIFYKFFLKIQDGCNNKCTFCVVRIARGKERSFSIKNIINKIKYFEQFGTKEIVLSGIHLGSYGKDLNNNLNLLINEMLEKTNISRIRLGSIEPWNITDRFLNLWKNKRMMPHLHLPLQSGSNSILKKMSRRCMKTYYCDLITEARKRIKDLNITTDVIVGFPGEKNQFFIESIIFIKKIFFGKIHIFPYSKKKETLSYFFKNTISLKKKKNRTFFLKKISDKMEFFFKKKQNNKITNILIESIIKKNNKYIASGYTENFIKISSPVSSMFFLNKIIKTKLLFKFNKIYFKKYCINNN
jgi:threonylcarbamoyladenosine tRNA methylthiotransferase MtaB